MTNVTRFRVDLQALKYQFLALERINVFGGDKPKITELCLSGGELLVLMPLLLQIRALNTYLISYLKKIYCYDLF